MYCGFHHLRNNHSVAIYGVSGACFFSFVGHTVVNDDVCTGFVDMCEVNIKSRLFVVGQVSAKEMKR